MKCVECHNFIMFSPTKGMCILAKVFMKEEQFTDPRVACDFWKPNRYMTIKKDGKIQYVEVKHDHLDVNDAMDCDEQKDH